MPNIPTVQYNVMINNFTGTITSSQHLQVYKVNKFSLNVVLLIEKIKRNGFESLLFGWFLEPFCGDHECVYTCISLSFI